MKLIRALAAVAVVVVLLGACAFGGGVQNMTPQQIKATEGMATCTTATTMYGKGSSITANTDDVKKGNSQKGKTTITCGDATMTIETEAVASQAARVVTPPVTVTPSPGGSVTITPIPASPPQ